MPQPRKDAPDAVDLSNMLASLGEEYAVVVYFSARLRNDRFELVAKSYGAPYTLEAEVQHVALATWEYRQPKDWIQQLFLLAFDLWLQHDGGGATAAKRGPTRDWRGQVEVPRRRRLK